MVLNPQDGKDNDWKQFNNKNDSSNYQAAVYDAQVINQVLKNKEYAPTIETREAKTYADLEKINTEAEKESNVINKKIAERQANMSTQYTSEEYKKAERDNQAYDSKQKKDHTTHSTGKDANNNYR